MSLGTQSFVGAGPINAMLSASTCNSAKFKRNFIVATIVRAVRIFTACGVMLWQGAVLLHKSVQKVSAHVLQPVPG